MTPSQQLCRRRITRLPCDRAVLNDAVERAAVRRDLRAVQRAPATADGGASADRRRVDDDGPRAEGVDAPVHDVRPEVGTADVRRAADCGDPAMLDVDVAPHLEHGRRRSIERARAGDDDVSADGHLARLRKHAERRDPKRLVRPGVDRPALAGDVAVVMCDGGTGRSARNRAHYREAQHHAEHSRNPHSIPSISMTMPAHYVRLRQNQAAPSPRARSRAGANARPGPARGPARGETWPQSVIRTTRPWPAPKPKPFSDT